MPKTNGARRCLETVEDLQEQNLPGTLDFNEELENDIDYTKIWKNPERLEDEDDFRELFGFLAREMSHRENYDGPLVICRKLKSDRLFSMLLENLINEERKKKIDPHLILSWLEFGDSEIQTISKKSYALLKLYYLCKNWKLKIDTFSCGCIQKITIEMFLATRLNEALHSVFKNSFLDLNRTIRRLLRSFADVTQLEFLTYYIETLQELYCCGAVLDPTSPSRVVQLMGLLCELQGPDLPEACSKINRTLGQLFEDPVDMFKKPSPALETVLKSKLIPKIFEGLMDNPEVQLEGFNRKENLQKYVALVEKENYSFAQKSMVFFAPLQLLLFICQKWDVWKRCQPVIKSKITSYDLASSKAPVILLYTTSLIFHIDSSLRDFFVEYLESQYQSADLEVKRTILTMFDILRMLLKVSSKSRILLTTPIEQSELVFENIKDLTPTEVNKFIQSNQSELDSAYSNDFFGALKSLDFYVSSDAAWQIAFQKTKERNSIEFIASQLKIIVARKEESVIKLRIGQIFEELRGDAPRRELLLTFSKVLLLFPLSEFATLPSNTLKLLVPVLTLAYCLYFDRNEQHILKLFRSLLEKIRGKENGASKEDPSTCMDIICTWLQSTDSSFLNKETFVKTLFRIFTDDKKSEDLQRVKERIADMASIVFSKLAAQLQKQGDSAKGNFCCLAILIEKWLSTSPSFGSEKICERAIEGYSMMNSNWNSIFTTSKVMKILTFAKGCNSQLLGKVIERIRGNEILLAALRSGKKKEFSVFDV